MRGRIRLVAAVVAVILGLPLLAQQHPNQKKGFDATGVYQFNGVDTINAFNGNLILSIPLGNSYPIGGGLSYQLALVANGNLWEGEEQYRDVNGDGAIDSVCPGPGSCADHERVIPNVMHPHRRVNAGLGWTVSLGRLYHPDHPTLSDNNVWTYESPDGADHAFESVDTNGYRTTTDGSYLRLIADNGSGGACSDVAGTCLRRRIEFPNGEVHWFRPPDAFIDHWALTSITNRFPGNALTIAYTPPANEDLGQTSSWTLTDSHGRSQIIRFTRMSYDGDLRNLVTSIELSRFGGASAAQIALNYEALTVNRGAHHSDDHAVGTVENPMTPQTTTVQILRSVTLTDGSSFAFQYLTGSTSDRDGGLVHQMTLPTGGRIEWDWTTYQRPAPYTQEAQLNEVTAISTRRVYDRGQPGALLGTWTYNHNSNCAPNAIDLNGVCNWYIYLPQTITDPLGNKTISYFSVSQQSQPPWIDYEYGQPMSRHKGDGNNRWLSSEVYATGSSTPLRSTYVKMVSNGNAREWRVESSRTVFEDDLVGGVARYVDSDSSGWDSYGRYKTATSSSNIAGTAVRESTTNYLPPSTAPNAPWITGLYDWKTVKENGQTIRIEADFDPANGFLRRQRSLRLFDGSRSTSDLVAAFTADSSGNVATESYYGGDSQSLAIDLPIKNLVLPSSPQYKVSHTYQYGSRNSSSSLNPNGTEALRLLTASIDQNTGLASSTTESGTVVTQYNYDASGRLDSVTPDGRAKLTYEYFPATSSAEAEVIQKVLTATGSVLSSNTYEYDGLGRVFREWTTMPGTTTLSRRDTFFDALGRKSSSSELGTATTLPATTYLYDVLGRVKTAMTPDGKSATFNYTGERVRTRTSGIAMTSTNDTAVTTQEEYDGYGRLLKVIEKSGATSATSTMGADVTTQYTYDPADRLVSVTMDGAAGTVQSRIFDYDGRGFLRWESHPEGGMTAYSYDAKGNVLSRQQSAANSLFDLTYTYDAAGRLLTVFGRNPHFNVSDPNQPAFRPMKKFTYATDNVGIDRRLGKPLTAARYNYHPSDPAGETWKVIETYVYADAAGRKTSRRTNITKGFGADESWWEDFREVSTAVTYNELDLPALVTYPYCVDCGTPPGPVRHQPFVYDNGRLTSSTGFLNSTTFWPNGMWNVMTRSNGVADTQTVDSSGMARPASISSGLSDACTIPTITVDPVGGTISGTTPTVTLSVGVTGTAPFTYEWFADGVLVGTSATFTANAANTPSTTGYRVRVANACKTVESVIATVSVGECIAPGGSATFSRNANGTYVLEALASGTEPRTYTWKRTSDQSSVGSGRKVTVGPLSASTTYTVTIANGCSGSPVTRDVTVTIPAAASAIVLTALRVSNTNQIQVTWTGSATGVAYVLQRRSGVTGWADLPALTSTQLTSRSYTDSVGANQTYAYRLRTPNDTQNGSAFTAADVATTTTFTPPSSGAVVSASSLEPMLAAVNSVRAAAGWPTVTWSNILSSRDPLPAPSMVIVSTHVTSCRARMNEALQALGVPTLPYTDAELRGVSMKSIHLNEIMGRAY